MFEDCYIDVVRFTVIDQNGVKRIARSVLAADEPITEEYKEKMVGRDLVLLYSGIGNVSIPSTYQELSKEEYEDLIGHTELDPVQLFQDAILQTKHYYMERNIDYNYSIRFYCRIASAFDNLRDERLPYNEQWQDILKTYIER